MRLLKIKIKGLKLFKEILEIDFTVIQRVRKEKNEMLYEISPQIRTNNALAFIGINASGKTTTLKVISFVIQLLNNKSINNIESKDILKGLKNDEEVEIESYYSIGNDSVKKLLTRIKKDEMLQDGEDKYIIDSELLWSKSVKSVTTIKELFEFKDADLEKVRDKNEEYLPDDISIIIASNKKNSIKINYMDTIDWTNVNLIRILEDFPKELIHFLDPSIEYIKTNLNSDNEKLEITLKFYSKDELLLYSPIELTKYLSSGTIKGINVFVYAMKVLEEGGYLLIDELENHFNKEIVLTLVRFFMTKKINKKGATIIFSTHYPELLDEFERNDNIFIVRNQEGIQVDNLARILDRSDIKRSEIYQSGYLQGTAPSYETYMNLKKIFMNSKEK